MRPSISPINSAIYGVQESSLAPVEDLALSLEDFESLCRDALLKPHARNLTLKPHLLLWNVTRASGHVEIEGFLPGSVLRLSGFKMTLEPSLLDSRIQELFLESLEKSLLKSLRQQFPEAHLTISPATVMRRPGSDVPASVSRES